MNSTTRTRKTTRPVSDRFATSWPQLAPISSCDISLGVAPIVWRMVSTTSWESSVFSCLVWTMMLLVTGGGHDRRAGPVDAGARPPPRGARPRRPGSPVRREGQLYCAPPTNSMPMFRPLKYRPSMASSTMRPEMEYQSRLAPDEVDRLLARVEVVAEPRELAHQALPPTVAPGVTGAEVDPVDAQRLRRRGRTAGDHG